MRRCSEAVCMERVVVYAQDHAHAHAHAQAQASLVGPQGEQEDATEAELWQRQLWQVVAHCSQLIPSISLCEQLRVAGIQHQQVRGSADATVPMLWCWCCGADAGADATVLMLWCCCWCWCCGAVAVAGAVVLLLMLVLMLWC